MVADALECGPPILLVDTAGESESKHGVGLGRDRARLVDGAGNPGRLSTADQVRDGATQRRRDVGPRPSLDPFLDDCRNFSGVLRHLSD